MKMCADSNMNKRWEDIDFSAAENHVKKLQKRIVVAYRKGCIDKVKFLQNTLIHSFYAKALAVRCVCSKRGKHTPGVDGIVWDTSEKKYQAILELKRRGYKPMPLKRVYIPKSNGKMRPLNIPTMKDRAMQCLYKFALEPIAEITADNDSYGFRSKRNAKMAVNRCGTLLLKNSFDWIIKGDIKSCFDNISHEWLIEHIPMDKVILKKFLKIGYKYKGIYYPNYRGIPQGACLSSVICNMTLDGLQCDLYKEFGCNVHFVRYADDFALTVRTPKILRSIMPVISNFLSKRGLRLSKEKTNIFNATEGFVFLGYEIKRENDNVYCLPSDNSVLSLLNNIKRLNTVSTDILNKIVFDKVRGWLNYYDLDNKDISQLADKVISLLTESTGIKNFANVILKLLIKNITK